MEQHADPGHILKARLRDPMDIIPLSGGISPRLFLICTGFSFFPMVTGVQKRWCPRPIAPG
jgi:hypothetical protein